MNYYIITGTSRGLGEAIAYKMISRNNYLFCISRNRNNRLISTAKQNKCGILYFEYDLENLESLHQLIKEIISNVNFENVESMCLINNAGNVNPIKPIGKCLDQDIIRNVKVNAIAPMVLTNDFIKYTDKFDCEKLVINISSGAGKKPYYGWGSYCSSKAAIDMFTQTAGIEQINKKNGVKVYSFSPGIIDTSMQQDIRKSKEEDFEQLERFKKFKEDGLLKEADFVAQKILEIILKKDIKNGALLNITEL